MKQFIACLLLILSLTACGSDSDFATNTDDTTNPEASVQKMGYSEGEIYDPGNNPDGYILADGTGTVVVLLESADAAEVSEVDTDVVGVDTVWFELTETAPLVLTNNEEGLQYISTIEVLDQYSTPFLTVDADNLVVSTDLAPGTYAIRLTAAHTEVSPLPIFIWFGDHEAKSFTMGPWGDFGHSESALQVRLNSAPGCQLDGLSLPNQDLHDVDLGHASLREANLSGANLSGAYLKEADLSRANLSFANLRSVDLVFANLNGVNMLLAWLTGADLTGAKIKYANLSLATINRASLQYATLYKTDLRVTNFMYSDLRYAQITDVILNPEHYFGIDYKNDHFGISELYAADLSYANFDGRICAENSIGSCK